ncbi:hypothetical protein IFM89_001285 [Coptis chinensis]|uniref:Uncharacterized protein n=1 Tax=Coptis chinensis TaxID=261450 RepID=A0A835H2L8_9MAGN|nr:hypothetical protein IFM89_001285 [Coptis chinensis]
MVLRKSLNKEGVTIEDASPQKDKRDHGDPNDPRVRLKCDCVGIMGAFELMDLHLFVLRSKESSCTHLFWDPEWADVKLAQAKYLLPHMAQFKARVSDKFGCNASILVCGGFNSTSGPWRSEPPFISCKPDFTTIIDYILFSPSEQLEPVAVLKLPGPVSSEVIGGIA